MIYCERRIELALPRSERYSEREVVLLQGLMAEVVCQAIGTPGGERDGFR